MLPGETVLSGAESNEENRNVSAFKVMRTPAGWYIGTTIDGMPNTRETDYFADEVAATTALEKYKATGVLDRQRY